MAETTLQIYDPQEAATAVPETAGALNAGSMQQGITITQRAPLLKRIVWWLSLAVMLPVGLGVLQMLALLVQAERVRGALELGAATAQLPKATPGEILNRTYQALHEMNFSTFEVHFTGGIPFTSIGYTSNSDRMKTNHNWSSDLEGLQVFIPTTELLPFWLGPRMPFVGTDEVHVQLEISVGQEE